MSSLINLFTSNTYKMNESNTFLSNWEFKDITFKELIELDFPLPKWDIMIDTKVYSNF